MAGCAAQDHTARRGDAVYLNVLSYNIEFDKYDWPGRLQYMLGEFRRHEIDILGLQEVIQRETLDNQAMTIADSLGFEWHFGSVDALDRDQRYGNAIVSRFPIEEAKFHALEPVDAYRKVVHTRHTIQGHVIDVYNTHLHNPPDAGPTRIRQIEDLLDFIDRTHGRGLIILTGDFNAAPDWPEMERLYEAFTDVYPLFYEDHLAPEHTTLNPRRGFPERRIDYVFYRNAGDARVTVVSAERILDDAHADHDLESDHFGVFARFRIEN
jgi:endonuclease/exonuclease/phosphatase family metal-dependent hydrolase